MFLNKNYQAKSKVPDNYFKHIHSYSNHVTKGPIMDCLHQVSSHTNFSTKLATKQKNEMLLFKIDLLENVYILG